MNKPREVNATLQNQRMSQSQNWCQVYLWGFKAIAWGSPGRLESLRFWHDVRKLVETVGGGGSGIPPIISADCHTTVTEPCVCSHTVHWSSTKHTWQHLSNPRMSSFILQHRNTKVKLGLHFDCLVWTQVWFHLSLLSQWFLITLYFLARKHGTFAHQCEYLHEFSQ